MVRVAPGATHLFAQRGNFGVMGLGVFRPNRIAGPKTAGHPSRSRALHHQAAEGRTRYRRMAGMQALLLVAEHDGPPMFARIGIMRALNRHVERVFDSSRKEKQGGHRKLARDR